MRVKYRPPAEPTNDQRKLSEYYGLVFDEEKEYTAVARMGPTLKTQEHIGLWADVAFFADADGRPLTESKEFEKLPDFVIKNNAIQQRP